MKEVLFSLNRASLIERLLAVDTSQLAGAISRLDCNQCLIFVEESGRRRSQPFPKRDLLDTASYLLLRSFSESIKKQPACVRVVVVVWGPSRASHSASSVASLRLLDIQYLFPQRSNSINASVHIFKI
ncbi:hypothetical protein BaRGS_00000335 [Batillaria attramentaria]|uniref:Uncharacterized protein n=1 Tax=Batillaria attramentaria TaxID=370345 RepID=A0ABD0M9M2_9CAEN